jgi:hypothetical protein
MAKIASFSSRLITLFWSMNKLTMTRFRDSIVSITVTQNMLPTTWLKNKYGSQNQPLDPALPPPSRKYVQVLSLTVAFQSLRSDTRLRAFPVALTKLTLHIPRTDADDCGKCNATWHGRLMSKSSACQLGWILQSRHTCKLEGNNTDPENYKRKR